MAEDLENQLARFSLTEGEQTGIAVLDADVKDLELVGERCLVGSIIAEKSINREAFRSLMTNLWRIKAGIQFKEIQVNLWVIEFTEMKDKRRVLDGRPWLFDRHLVALEDFDSNTIPAQMSFTKAAFWIQVHDIPLVCMSKAVGLNIGASLGPVVAVEASGGASGWQKTLRIKVEIELSKPLERGRALHFRGRTYWASFRYEKLPRFCFSCGKIKHESEGCLVDTNPETKEKPYGVWLRADSINRPFGGLTGGGLAGSATPGRPQAGGAGLHKSGFGNSTGHGENSSPTGGDSPITPPDFQGTNQDGDPPHDSVAASVPPSAPRKASGQVVLTDGGAAQRDFRCLFNSSEAGRRLDKETAPLPCIALGFDILKKTHDGLDSEVLVGPPASQNMGHLAHGEMLAGNVHGLPCKGPGPVSEGKAPNDDTGPQQPIKPSIFLSNHGRETVGAQSQSAGLSCDIGNMQLLRLKDVVEVEEVTDLDVGGDIVVEGRGEVLPCSTLITQAPGKGFSQSPLSLKHWKRRARAQVQEPYSAYSEVTLRKRKGGAHVGGTRGPMAGDPSSLLAEASICKKGRSQIREGDCEMVEGGLVEAGSQPHRSL